MRSPKDMRIIEIDITNACVHRCSNCTRFCGHHKKPYFMNFETFRRAINSLTDFKRSIGLMGGEPTLHPQFQHFMEYLNQTKRISLKIETTRKPVKNFVSYMRDKNYFYSEALNDRKGYLLLTSLTNKYYENYEMIQDTFNYQLVNDHQNACLHQPLLVTRKELGIPDDKWYELRDKCWIQNEWSASITPKGAFFCEVAGAMDMLFDGPGGWPIEPGWWKREPKDFGDQLKWCEMCGGALLNCGRLSNEEIDDVSPLMYQKLQELGSPKLKKGKVHVLNMKNPTIEGVEMPDTIDRYLTDYQKRMSCENNILFANSLHAITFLRNQNMESLQNSFINLAQTFDSVIATSADNVTYESMKSIYTKDNLKIIPSVLNSWGRTLNKAIENDENNWVVLLEPSAKFTKLLYARLKTVVLNPGVLYHLDQLCSGRVILFNTMAQSLKTAGWDGVGKCNSIGDFIALWENSKQVTLDQNFDQVINCDLQDWEQYAKNLKRQDKWAIEECINKLKNDEANILAETLAAPNLVK